LRSLQSTIIQYCLKVMNSQIQFIIRSLQMVKSLGTVLLCNLKGHMRTQGYLDGGVIFFGPFFCTLILDNILTCPIFRDPLCSWITPRKFIWKPTLDIIILLPKYTPINHHNDLLYFDILEYQTHLQYNHWFWYTRRTFKLC
jgi:hypothetical protein